MVQASPSCTSEPQKRPGRSSTARSSTHQHQIWLEGQTAQKAKGDMQPHHIGIGEQFRVIRIQKVAPVQGSHGSRHPLAGDALLMHQGLHQSGLALVHG